MTHKDKIRWMKKWCDNNECTLLLKGECGFGRPCVGVLKNGCYPDYDDSHEPGDSQYIWTPEDAYHKHPCVAVLGRGKKAEKQLFKWLQWFFDNGYTVRSEIRIGPHDSIDLMMRRDVHNFMHKTKEESNGS